MAVKVGRSLWTQRVSYHQFAASKHIGEIDGLRAVAILFVLAGHMHDPMWGNVAGTGVPIFFVNSGFLITLLLIREQSRNGGIDWRGFYVRRAFRLLPVYFFAVALFTVLVLAGLAERPGDWGSRLIYFLTFQNEFVPGATFGHTWTLAVQEKFYIAWPLLAFALLSPLLERTRFWMAGVLAAGLTVGWILFPANYSVMFLPLILGCVIALAMSTPRGFRITSFLSRPVVFTALLGLAVLVKFFDQTPGKVSIPFAFAIALLMPGLVAGPQWASRFLTLRPLVFVGTIAYSVYLLHPLVLSAVDLVVARGQFNVALEITRYLGVVAGSLVFASVTYRFIEKPGVALGRKISAWSASRKTRSHPVDASEGRVAPQPAVRTDE